MRYVTSPLVSGSAGPPAQRLIRRTKAAKKRLADKRMTSPRCGNGWMIAAPNPLSQQV